jgi:hypothetical protein
LTEPATLEALRRLGVSPAELRYPADAILNEFSGNPRAREAARRGLMTEVDSLIAEVTRVREAVLREAQLHAEAAKSESAGRVFITEPELAAQAQLREQRRVENFVMGILQHQADEAAARTSRERESQRQRQRDEELVRRKRTQEAVRQHVAENREKHEQERLAKEAEARETAQARELEGMQRVGKEMRHRVLVPHEEEKERRERNAAALEQQREKEDMKRREIFGRMNAGLPHSIPWPGLTT